MKGRISRFEVNKEVRHILARHGVDTTLVTYQTYGREVNLTGILWHNDNSDFNGHQVEALIKDFQQTLPEYSIRGDTENWVFSTTSMSRVASPLRKEEEELPDPEEGQ